MPVKFNKFIGYKKKSSKLFYDNYLNLNWKVENFIINYTSDLISEPPDKSIKIYTKKDNFKLIFNYNKKYDLIRITNIRSGLIKIKKFRKKRATDFINELKHIMNINNEEKYKNSLFILNMD